MKRIKKQAGGCSPAWATVRDQLTKECFTNATLVKGVLKDGLTFSGCTQYILKKAREKAEMANGCRLACVETSTVYQWARDYYTQNP